MPRPECRFGSVAVEKGFVTVEQVAEALSIQVRETSYTGKHRPLGRIFLNEGLITFAQLGEVLDALKERTDEPCG
jgi:hypothetical protein